MTIFERRIIRKIFGPTRTDDGYWRIKTNQEINEILKGQNIIGFIKKQRLTLILRHSRMGTVWLHTSATHTLQCSHLNALHTEHAETWNHSLTRYFHII